MQNYLWDGIKRDRLVWVGDLHPEVTTVATVFGPHSIVPRSLDLARQTTPLPGWMNDIGSYSLWWILIQRDWYRYYADLDYLNEQKEYLSGSAEAGTFHPGQKRTGTPGRRHAFSGLAFK